MKISVLGATGAMGKNTIHSALQANHSIENKVSSKENISVLFRNTDVIIDFSSSIATEQMLLYLKKYQLNTPVVIGTTGLSRLHMDLMEDCSKFTSIFYSPNMSFLVAIMNVIISLVSKLLKPEEFDVEIHEIHHKLKKDAPSGTAIMFGKTIAEARNDNFLSVANFVRYGIIEPRKIGEIGFSVERCGKVTGKHEVKFAGENEILTISHEAYSKQVYATGAIKAAEWLYKQKPGLYNMRDLIKEITSPVLESISNS